MLSRLVITFFPRSKRLSISGLHSPSAVILEPPKIKSATVSTFSTICHELMGPDAMILVFWMLSFKPTFSLSSFTFTYPHIAHACMHACMLSCSVVSNSFAALWTVAHQAPLSMEFPRQVYWNRLPFLPSGDPEGSQGSNPCLWCLLHCRRILYQLKNLLKPQLRWVPSELWSEYFLQVKMIFIRSLCFCRWFWIVWRSMRI